MAIGSSLGITLPTQGGNTGTWGTDLNTELQKVIDAVEAQVPITAIDFSADLSFGGFAITDVKYSSFEQQATNPSALNSVWFSTSGNLYVRDGANNAIQLTASGALNTASNGGIGNSGGDYGTNDIVFDWTGTLYEARNGAGANDFANVRMDELQLRDGSGNDLTIAVPAMGANYTLTLPAAVPSGATTILQANTSGTVAFSNSFSTDITLTGAAELKYGTRTKAVLATAGSGGSAGTAPSMNPTYCYINMNSVGAVWAIPVDLEAGCRITQIDVHLDGGDGSTKTVYLDYKTDAGLTITNIASQTSTSSAAHVSSMASLTETVVAGRQYFVRFVGVHILDIIGGIEITYDRP